MADRCEAHAWAAGGVTESDGQAVRFWTCERCPAWTREVLDPDARVDWDETWIAGL